MLRAGSNPAPGTKLSPPPSSEAGFFHKFTLKNICLIHIEWAPQWVAR